MILKESRNSACGYLMKLKLVHSNHKTILIPKKGCAKWGEAGIEPATSCSLEISECFPKHESYH